MPPEVQLPVFEGNDVQKIEAAIRWTWKTLKKVNWPKEKIMKRALNQTPAELIAAGEVFYMNPCGPQTIVCLEALKANGFKPEAVIVLIRLNVRGKSVVAPHFALEVQGQSKLYHIEFKTNGVNFREGPFAKAWIPNSVPIKTFRVPGENFGLNKKIIEGAGWRIFKQASAMGYTLRAHREHLAKEANPSKFEVFQKVQARIKPGNLIHRK